MRRTPAACGFLLAVFAVHTGLAPGLWAQTDPVDLLAKENQKSQQLAETWLASADPRIRAWGAHLVLRESLKRLTPALLSQVSEYQLSQDSDLDQHDALLVALDTLIQLGTPVPASEAAKIFPEFPAQSLIFLSRDGNEAIEPLLKIFRESESQGGAWLAAGNLLAQRRAPGFAAAVLGGMTGHAIVTISDSGAGVGSGGGSSRACGWGGGRPKPGWPQVGHYEIGSYGGPGGIVLVLGADPAYYLRIVSGFYANKPEPGVGCVPDMNLIREHYLAELLRTPEGRPPIWHLVYHDISWTGPDKYRADLVAFIDQQQALFARVAQSLKEEDLLAQDELLAARPMLRVTLSDRRSREFGALPALTATPARVFVEGPS